VARSTGENPKDYLLVKVDDPSLIALLNAALFASEDHGLEQLVSNRRRADARAVMKFSTCQQEGNMGEEMTSRSEDYSEIQIDGQPHHAEKAIPFAERLTCSVADACDATSLGKTKLYELIATGTVRTKNVGRRRLVLVESLRAWLLEDQ
jgi:hypothetical protein